MQKFNCVEWNFLCLFMLIILCKILLERLKILVWSQKKQNKTVLVSYVFFVSFVSRFISTVIFNFHWNFLFWSHFIEICRYRRQCEYHPVHWVSSSLISSRLFMHNLVTIAMPNSWLIASNQRKIWGLLFLIKRLVSVTIVARLCTL